jgi:hypothetical protein
MSLNLDDFDIDTDLIPSSELERINDAISTLRTVDQGEGEFPEAPESRILVSTKLRDRAGFTSIQDAIDGENSQNGASGAGEDDTIFVEPGDYESVTIDVEGLTLKGPNAGIDGDSDQRGAEANINGLVAVDAEQVTIDGFAIEREASGSLNQKGVIQMGAVGDSASGSTIANNVITPDDTNGGNARLGGVAIESADNVTISDNVIAPADGSAATIGITRYVSNIENLTVSDNVIETDVAIASGGGEFSYSASITDNEFDSSAIGITVNEAESLDITIADNVFNGGPNYVFSVDSEFEPKFDVEGEKLDLQPILDNQGNTFNTKGDAVITEFEDVNSTLIVEDDPS